MMLMLATNKYMYILHNKYNVIRIVFLCPKGHIYFPYYIHWLQTFNLDNIY